MSDFFRQLYCGKCGESTQHHFRDNVPRYHHYTIVCTVCSTVNVEDIVDYIAVKLGIVDEKG